MARSPAIRSASRPVRFASTAGKELSDACSNPSPLPTPRACYCDEGPPEAGGGAAVISLFKSASELERLEEFRKKAMEYYGRAISSTEQNVIELDEKQAAAFRSELQSLLKHLGKAPEDLA